jgi:hypothetical protein
MLKYIFWALVIYFLVRFVINFLIPVVRAGRQMRNQMKDFQEKMNQQTQFQGGNNTNNYAPKQENKARAGDYIDFEEIK